MLHAGSFKQKSQKNIHVEYQMVFLMASSVTVQFVQYLIQTELVVLVPK
jgi:hypothetical protein